MSLEAANTSVGRIRGIPGRLRRLKASTPRLEPPSFGSLPADMILDVLDYIVATLSEAEAQLVLSRCCLVSRAFRILVIPFLRVRVRLEVEPEPYIGGLRLSDTSLRRLGGLYSQRVRLPKRLLPLEPPYLQPAWKLLPAVPSVELVHSPKLRWWNAFSLESKLILEDLAHQTSHPLELILPGLQHQHITSFVLSLFSRRVQHLTISSFDPRFWPLLAECPQLVSLRLVGTFPTSHTFTFSRSIASLRYLTFDCSSAIQGAALDALFPLIPNLTFLSLRLEWCSATTAFALPLSLASLTLLETFRLSLTQPVNRAGQRLVAPPSARLGLAQNTIRNLIALLAEDTTESLALSSRYEVKLAQSVAEDEAVWQEALVRSNLPGLLKADPALARVKAVTMLEVDEVY
ncbi:hypothetical protein JCM8097_005099 [Rhodosporidiobolus ruineniae]